MEGVAKLMSNWIDIMGWPTSDRAGDPDTFVIT